MDDPDRSAATPVRIARLTIDELFGPGSSPIDIEFKLDQRVTVLHGRNGSGKTITLKLIEAIQEGRFEVLAEYPLKRLRMELSDGSSLVFERQAPQDTPEGPAPWRFEYRIQQTGKSEHPGTIAAGQLSRFTLAAWIRELARNRLKSNTGTHRYPSLPAYKKLLLADHREEHAALYELLDRLPEIKFIKADRLFVRAPELTDPDYEDDDEPPAPELMVERLSQDIRRHIIEADREYRRTSTRLDSTLPRRLFADHGELPSLDELERRERDLHDQTERLLNVGLLRERPETLDRSQLTEDQKKTFFIILKDREEKLAPFASIASKAQRLLDSLNRKLAPKSVRLDVETGYQVFTANGTALPLDCLSSGEQHELVLLHELLFEVQPGSLILIDEPELSLHVTWQADVLPDLLAIAELADLDIVLATHSPYIVGDRNDLMVRLGEPV